MAAAVIGNLVKDVVKNIGVKSTDDITVSLTDNGHGNIAIAYGSTTLGTSQGGAAYRYVSQNEYEFILKNGYIPNTTANGSPKDVYVSPNRYNSITEAESALRIGSQNPNGATGSPAYRVEFKIDAVSYDYAGKVEGGTGIEMTTKEKIPVDAGRIVALKNSNDQNDNDKDANGGSSGSKKVEITIVSDETGQLYTRYEDGTYNEIETSPLYPNGMYFLPINPFMPSIGVGYFLGAIPAFAW